VTTAAGRSPAAAAAGTTHRRSRVTHVIAHHRVGDRAGFLRWTGEPAAGRPPHWRLILSAPTADGAACFALWWADSAAALQQFLQRTLGDVGPVECHEIDVENALGLENLALPAAACIRLQQQQTSREPS
jgi:hypothetical protein